MADHAKEIGTMQEAISNSKDNITTLFESNARRKKENHDVALNLNDIQHTVEETSTVINGVATSMEKLTQDIADIKNNQIHMDTRITVIEDRMFNWSKFLSGLISPKGMILTTVFCIMFTIMFLAVVSPEHLPQFFDVVKAKAGQ